MRKQRGLIIAAAIAAGIVIGLGSFTFVYAKGYSYLTKSPEACANCHIMNEHYAAWLKSSHRASAGCNDCHTPHSLIPKYATKARNGFWHSFYFTTGNYPDPLRITERNHDIVEHACRDCHERLVASMHAGSDVPPNEVTAVDSREGVECTHCHRYVGHQVR